jgi:phosphatidylcholine synthase
MVHERRDGGKPMNLLLAWCVHLYTAAGAVAAFFGTVAVFEERYREAFLWMIAATFIDATDGVLARRAQVAARLPQIDGGRLDDIVDYLTFVFLPALLAYRAGLLPSAIDEVVVAAMLLSSAYGFTAADAKTDDYFFTGFPSYWNIVVLYLYVGVHAGLLKALLAAVILLVLSAMVFWRVGYVYPSRTPVWRAATVGLGVIWAAMVVAIVWMLPAISPALVLLSLAYPVYYVALSATLQSRRGKAMAVSP